MLQLCALTHTFNDTPLFENLHYDFNIESIHLIKGENGSGKSTLLKIMSGLIPPLAGKVLLKNRNLYTLSPPYSHSSYSPADSNVFIPNASLKDNFNFYIKTLTKINLNIYFELVENFQLKSDLDKKWSYLSSGKKKKASLILTLCKQSKYYCFDEPFAFLDSDSKKVLALKLNSLAKNNKLVIIATNQTLELDFPNKTLQLKTDSL